VGDPAVYKSFFGLKKNPFNVNPDPSYLYLTPSMRQALDELTYGIEGRKGLMLLTGEAGTGKTTLMNHLLLWLSHRRARTAFIFNSHLDSDQLFDFILSDFEIPPTPQAKTNPLLAFNEWLLARYRAHDLVVLIVDEAQGLPSHVLEEIRLLSNMETPNEKLLQIVLAGQPELEMKLKRPDLRQLQQRIALRCKTAQLTLQETRGYIEDRMHTAGSQGDEVFLPEAVEAVHNYSRGIPRVVNLLCENALINAYVEQQHAISSILIDEAARELQFDELKPVAPRFRSINPFAEAPELHSILAKIKADADGQAAWFETQRTVPYLVSTQKASVSRQGDPFTVRGSEIQGETRSQTPALANLRANEYAGPRVHTRGWRRTSSPSYISTNLLAVRALYDRLDFRAATEPVLRSIRAFEFRSRMKRLANRIRLAAEPGVARTLEFLGPEVRARASAVRSASAPLVARINRWCAENFGAEMYGKSFVATAAVSAVLYLIARRIDPAQAWQHPGPMVAGFAGFLLCALSLALGITILVRARHKLRTDASEAMANTMRWLRAPINPMQMRELGSIGDKAHSHRRA
jgi:general secretion pathway protein A